MTKMLKKAVFVTDNPNKKLLEKLKEATADRKIELVIAPFTIKTISEISRGGFGVFIVDSQESEHVGLFHRVTRILRSETPCLYFHKNVILFDAGITQKFDSNANAEALGELLIKCIKFDTELKETNRIFNERVDEVKHLTGDELTKAMDEIRKDIFRPRFEKLVEEDRKGANKLPKNIPIPPQKRPNLGQMLESSHP